jgi:hypothetical protein
MGLRGRLSNLPTPLESFLRGKKTGGKRSEKDV